MNGCKHLFNTKMEKKRNTRGKILDIIYNIANIIVFAIMMNYNIESHFMDP